MMIDYNICIIMNHDLIYQAAYEIPALYCTVLPTHTSRKLF